MGSKKKSEPLGVWKKKHVSGVVTPKKKLVAGFLHNPIDNC